MPQRGSSGLNIVTAAQQSRIPYPTEGTPSHEKLITTMYPRLSANDISPSIASSAEPSIALIDCRTRSRQDAIKVIISP